MSDTVTLIVDGIPHELPLVTGTEGERAVDISRLRSTTGLITLDDAYSNTGSSTVNAASCDTAGFPSRTSPPAPPSSRWRNC